MVNNLEIKDSQNKDYMKISEVILPRANVLLLNIGCIGCNIISSSFLFKMADLNAGYLKLKLDALAPKVCKKKNPTCVCG